MPTKVPITSCTLTPNGFTKIDGDKLEELIINFDDPSGSNYYQIRVAYEQVYKNGNIVYNTPYEITTSISGDGPFSDQDRNILFNDVSFNGKPYKLRLGIGGSNQFGSDVVTTALLVQLSSITKDAFLYEKSLAEYYRSEGNPFGAEPSQINTNFTNGYGLFQIRRNSTFRIKL